MMEQVPKLVIFDCDGVLVDSEPISISVLVEAITRAGGSIDMDEAYDRFLGRSLSTIIGMLAKDYGLVASDGFLEEMRQELYGRFERELQPIAGIGAAIDRLPYGALRGLIQPVWSESAFVWT